MLFAPLCMLAEPLAQNTANAWPPLENRENARPLASGAQAAADKPGNVQLLPADALAAAELPVASRSLPIGARVAADKPENVHPLLIGAQVPAEVPLQTVEGKATVLAEVLGGKPAVLVFFRGGWCPYCDLQLSELRLIEADLQALGYQIIAISPDPPPALKARKERIELAYHLVSDNTAALIEAFGIAFEVAHRVLPVPAVYIVDSTGKVQFQYVNPDYRTRLPKDLLLTAARTSLPAQR